MIAAYLIALTSATLGQTTSVTHADTFTPGQYPARVAADGGGGIYVTDPTTNQVIQLDALGASAGTFAIAETPVGIARHNGNIYVSRADGVVGIYDAAFVLQGTLNSAPVVMVAPNDIAVHPLTGEIYVVDAGGHMIVVFDGTTGLLTRSWGMEGSGLSEFMTPQSLAIDAALDHVIVTDTDNFRVQVFDTTGILQFKFGYRILFTTGGEVAWFARVEGVAVDSCSNIYITDAVMGTVRVFDALGNELDPTHAPVINYGTAAGELRVPCDIMIDMADRMYVSSYNNASVEVYDLDCTPAVAPATESANRALAKRERLTGRAAKAKRVDNPYDIITAMADGEAPRALDINNDRRVDLLDLEEAVKQFDGATLEQFLLGMNANVAVPGSYEPPHMIDIDNLCGRCHSVDGLPEGMLTAAGQENLCLSCHQGGGIAKDKPVAGTGQNNSHPWGVPATSGDVAGPDPASIADLDLHLDGGNIRCGTCHNPHESTDGTPLLRATVETGALCMECHRGAGAPTIHAVGTEHGPEYCSDCHATHSTSTNLHLIHDSFIDPHELTTNPVAFDDHTLAVGPGGFVDPDPNVTGVCEACHDFPSNQLVVPPHTLDGSMPVCTECHTHENGFKPGLGTLSSLHRGGLLYDKWWKVNGAAEPTGDHPLYPPAGAKSGNTTFRCKECHGWDYKGAAGVYAAGSHFTGIPGILGTVMTEGELFDIIKNDPGTTTNGHDLGAYGLSDADIDDLVTFITTGLLDTDDYIDSSSKAFLGDVTNGFGYFSGFYDPADACFICHGTDGRAIEFHAGEFLGTLANGNPWETLHKIRFGQPGQPMNGFVGLGHSDQDAADTGAYAQTLPTAALPGANAVRGGLLYDKWWKVNGAAEPTGDHPLYPLAGAKSGSTTFRCKECHGWDYKGAAGAYAGGSHFTGIPGIHGTVMTEPQLFAIIKDDPGTTTNGHDFGAYGMSDADIDDLVEFVFNNLIDTDLHIDGAGVFIGTPVPDGQDLYNGVTEPAASCTLCHGATGQAIDFGGGTYVGTVANANPWETLHKIRFGQPAEPMCSFVNLGLSDGQAADVGLFAQSLPQ